MHTRPGMYSDLINREFWPEVRALRCPTLNILAEPGTYGEDNSPEFQQKMIEINSLCEAAVIRNSSHAIHFDQTEELVRVVSEFLARQTIKE